MQLKITSIYMNEFFSNKLKSKLIILFILAFSIATGQTPTEKYLEQISETALEEIINRYQPTAFPFRQYLPFFRSIIANENEDFIGYHATTTAHMIYQEFIRAVLEQKNGKKFPHDFYFLRETGDPKYDIQGTPEIFKKYARPEFTDEELRSVVITLIDIPIHNLSGYHLEWDRITCNDIELLYNALIEHTFVPNNILSEDEASNVLEKILTKAIPEHCKESIMPAITQFIKSPFDDEFKDLYPKWLPYKRINFPFDDTSKSLQQKVIALNIPLYANSFISTESTIHIFARNQSIDMGKTYSYFKKRTKAFLEKHKIPTDSVDKTFRWAQKQFRKDTGVILQFFAPQSLSLDTFIYATGNFGAPITEKKPIREVLAACNGVWQKELPVEFPLPYRELLEHTQLRLVLTNDITLNPNSGITIKVHDLVPVEAKKKLKKMIQKSIRRS